jgi:hypothetical protein
MKIATIHRNEHDCTWIVLIRDTIKETRCERIASDLAEAEAIAEEMGSQRTKVMLG